MNRTRYCSTCGTLLSEDAVICGECGARYQPSPYERRATDAPGAWSAPPRQRSRELDAQQGPAAEEEGIELLAPGALRPLPSGATAPREKEQYDRVMVTQPPMHPPGPGTGAPGGPAAPGPGPGAATAPASAAPVFEKPLDGCVPASALKRLLAALIDAVLAAVVTVPLLIGLGLLLFSQDPGLLPQILVGVGVAVPLAYHLVMIWLVGAKGFTLGKLALGLRVTRAGRAGALGFGRALGRWFLYGLIPPLMALSIFFDPRTQLRGFHDRAVDSVVVDAREGRDPMKPRPDDFERAGAEHYLGAPSVAVSAHENLLAEPGAAWRDPGFAPAQPGGEAPQGVPSPYAPQPSAGSAPEAPASSWGSPPPAAPATDGGWAPSPAAPSPAAPAPPTTAAWDAPSDPATQWAPPSAPDTARADAGPPAAGAAGAPADLTGDAWGEPDDSVDEATRLSGAAGLGDLEATRISSGHLPPVKQVRLTTDDGVEHIVDRAAVVGRNPAAGGDELLVVVHDETRSVSKTHLRIDGTGEDLVVTDLGSTNGSTVLREDGSRENLVPQTPSVLPEGARVTLGDRTLSVERVQ